MTPRPAKKGEGEMLPVYRLAKGAALRKQWFQRLGGPALPIIAFHTPRPMTAEEREYYRFPRGVRT